MKYVFALLFSIAFLCCNAQSSDTKSDTATAGQHLQKARDRVFLGLTVQAIGAAIVTLGVIEENKPVTYVGGTLFILGTVIQFSAWNSVGRAGDALESQRK